MTGMRFTVAVHLHGTLAANAQGAFQLPCPATLLEVSAVASNDSAATLQLGTSADADGLMTAKAIGDSSTPVVFTRGRSGNYFDGALVDENQYPALDDDTIVTWVLDYDGAGGTAAQHVDILFTFLEG
ncbi:MAG: hypothetical protein M5U01_10320 [Ardenticatenaceae bacterium]|nr:hypothetical protein [Ardenticatenaceae bacterium]